jgi:hypothetical protein
MRNFLFAAGMLLCVASRASDAGMIAAPSGLNPGDQFRLMFLTDGTTSSASGDHTFYDAVVASEASSAGIGTYNGNPVTWQALISSTDGTRAIDRLPADSIPIYLLDGTLVDSGGAALWSYDAILHPINLTPTGNVLDVRVWTGTFNSGFPFGPLSEGGGGMTGLSSRTDFNWVSSSRFFVDANHNLYGFSSVLTVPESVQSVPEPATVTMLATGGIFLAGACRYGRRRRK